MIHILYGIFPTKKALTALDISASELEQACHVSLISSALYCIYTKTSLVIVQFCRKLQLREAINVLLQRQSSYKNIKLIINGCTVCT